MGPDQKVALRELIVYRGHGIAILSRVVQTNTHGRAKDDGQNLKHHNKRTTHLNPTTLQCGDVVVIETDAEPREHYLVAGQSALTLHTRTAQKDSIMVMPGG